MGSASKKRKVFPGESRRQAFLPAIEIPAGRKSEPAFIWREKMTLREAAEKALMALTFAEESGRHWPMAVKMARNAAIDALRAELAKPDAAPRQAPAKPQPIAAQASEVEALRKRAETWELLYMRAINEANGLTNYVEDRPELSKIERKLVAIEAAARAALKEQTP